MARAVARGLAALNAACQGVVGLILIAHPAIGGRLYQLTALSPVASALSRIAGGLMAGSALVLALWACRPQAHAALAPLIAAGCVINLVAAGAACLAGEIGWTQVMGAIVFQLALAVALGVDLIHAGASGRGGPPNPADRRKGA